MKILDGRKVREKIIDEIKVKLVNIDKKLSIVVIGIGDSEVNDLYVRQKEKLFDSLGLGFQYIKFNSDIEEDEILRFIDEINNDDSIDGIMVELPIIGNFDRDKILNRIDYRKDVDGLGFINREKLSKGEECVISSTVLAILKILDYYNISLDNKKIVVVGNGFLVGRPLAMLLNNMDVNFIVCNSKTKDIYKIISNGDIIISCVGKKNIINKDMLRDGQAIIDVGVFCDGDIIFGDVYRDGLDKIDLVITPLIGGIGVVTTACLVSNLVLCYENNLVDTY